MSDTREIRLEHFTARRTARCAVRGPERASAVRELWMVLHGYAHLAHDFIAGLDALDDGTRLIVAPEALSRFYDARGERDQHQEAKVGASWMTREDRLREIDDTLGWLQLAYESFATRLKAEVPVTVLGFSQGGAAASRWVAAGRVPARNLICWGASLAPELELGEQSALRRVRCSIVIGDRDKFISPAQVAAEQARLAAARFPHRFVVFSGGHRLDDATLRGVSLDAR